MIVGPDEICSRPGRVPPPATEPRVTPIYPAVVYRCENPDQASRLLSGEISGYVYSRDGHPNADLLAEKCRALHGAERAVICGSGMSALSVAALALCERGTRVVASNQLYGRSQQLFTTELGRLGIESRLVDMQDLEAVTESFESAASLLVVETITNPMLRVADLAALAELAHRAGARLLVDNTFASPVVCRPMALGADLVMESLTKVMNGHADVLLGMLCGAAETWARVPNVVSTWGLGASPFECWLAERGLGTLAVRVERASANARAAAEFLAGRKEVKAVYYPGLESHPDHAVAARQFGDCFGTMVTFALDGAAGAATRFIRAAQGVPFSPSLGELSTTLSHPQSTSHRSIPEPQRSALGIEGGTIRLSLGIESTGAVLEALTEGLSGI